MRSPGSVSLLLLNFAFGGLVWSDEPLDPNLPYSGTLSDPIEHEVDFSVVVTPPYHCRVLKVWLPLPQTSNAQIVSEGRLSTFPMQVEPHVNVEPRFGNKFAYFEFHEPQGAQIVRHRFKAKVFQVDWNLQPENVQAVASWPMSFDVYREPDEVASLGDIQEIVQSLVPRINNPAGDFFKLAEWIDSNLTYDHVKASLRADAEHAFTLRRGHCSDYHGLCSTMTRALGYPARVTYGLGLYPKNSPSHCKVEAFLPPYGWVSFDVSETQKLVEKIGKDEKLSEEQQQRLNKAARDRFHAGFRENSWLLLTSGTNYELVPPAAAGKVPVVRTIYAEADGVALPDPDPANVEQREFAWMTVHEYKSDKPFKKPFSDYSTLEIKP